eukprot:5521061-Prorocentrum_lima.AAC.1
MIDIPRHQPDQRHLTRCQCPDTCFQNTHEPYGDCNRSTVGWKTMLGRNKTLDVPLVLQETSPMR